MKKIILALTMCVFAGFTFTAPAESAPRQNHGYSQTQIKKTTVRKKTNVRKQTVRKNNKKRVRTVVSRTNAVAPQVAQPAQTFNVLNDEESTAAYWAREQERAQRQAQTAAAFGDTTAGRAVRQQRSNRNNTYDRNTAQPIVFWNSNNHMQRAESMIGLTAKGNRQELKSTFARTLGQGIDPTRIPWCAAWANAVLAESGIEGTGSLMARSFTDWGKPTAAPVKGDVVVLRRGRGNRTGHVGFFYGFVDHNGVKKVALLGGNQGKQVRISYYPISRVIAYRTVG